MPNDETPPPREPIDPNPYASPRSTEPIAGPHAGLSSEVRRLCYEARHFYWFFLLAMVLGCIPGMLIPVGMGLYLIRRLKTAQSSFPSEADQRALSEALKAATIYTSVAGGMIALGIALLATCLAAFSF